MSKSLITERRPKNGKRRTVGIGNRPDHRWRMLVLGLALVALQITDAQAVEGETLQFYRACSQETCEMVESEDPAGATRIYSTAMIIDSTFCPGVCSFIGGSNRGSLHVYGNWLDLTCKARGGILCVWADESFPREAAEDAFEAILLKKPIPCYEK